MGSRTLLALSQGAASAHRVGKRQPPEHPWGCWRTCLAGTDVPQWDLASFQGCIWCHLGHCLSLSSPSPAPPVLMLCISSLWAGTRLFIWDQGHQAGALVAVGHPWHGVAMGTWSVCPVSCSSPVTPTELILGLRIISHHYEQQGWHPVGKPTLSSHDAGAQTVPKHPMQTSLVLGGPGKSPTSPSPHPSPSNIP